jgi:hypothetical protein
MAEETPPTDAPSVKESDTRSSPLDDMAVPSAWKDTIDGPPPTQQPQQRPMASSSTFSPVVDVSHGAENEHHSPQPSVSSDVYVGMGRRDVVTPPVTHNTSASGGSGATTPQLSPSLIANLRGTSSPSHSQVSVGSAVNPSLMSAVLSASSHKHYDLTPVMRNTSDLYCDAKGVNTTISGSETMTITPSSQEGYLHGEHLAFPSDLSRASLSSGPPMPPLQPVIHRRNSSGNMQSLDSGSANEDDPSSFLQMDSIMPTGLYRNEIEIPNEPVQFPAARKYYSFTTREQYEEACRYADDSDDDLYIPSDSDDDMVVAGKGLLPRGLTPYAPRSRPANFDIEQLPEEELKRIFISRAEEPPSQDQATDSAIPLEQRIPSLRMANHLLNESTTSISYTDNEDEDSVLRLAPRNENDDAASLSSLGSNHRMMDDDEDDEDMLVTQLRHRRKRKQRKKEAQAQEWLQSTVASANIAEAASSKFLTTTQPLYKSVALHRPVSSPAQVVPSPSRIEL